MIWHKIWPDKQHRIGLSVDGAGFSIVCVSHKPVTEVVDQYVEAWNQGFSFEQIALSLKRIVRELGWHKAGLSVATEQAELKQLAFQQIPDKELPQAVYWEMFTQWGIQPEEHVLVWLPPQAGQELQVGSLPNETVQSYSRLAQDAGLYLDLLTTALPAEQAALAEQGTVLNFLQDRQRVQKPWRQELPDVLRYVCYTLGVVFGGLCLAWAGLRYGLWQEENRLQGLQLQKNQYTEAVELQRKIGELQNSLRWADRQHAFRTVLIEKILDAMPPFDNEIISLQMQNLGDRGRGLEIAGRMGNFQDLQIFVKNLQTADIFDKVTLRSSQRDSSGLNYVISGTYGVHHVEK